MTALTRFGAARRVAGTRAVRLLALASVVSEHEGTTLEFASDGCLDGFSDDEVDFMIRFTKAGNRPLNWNVLTIDSKEPGRIPRQLSAGDIASKAGGRIEAITKPVTPYVFNTPPSDRIALGDALLSVDPNSVIFQPSASQSALQTLLEQEAEQRRRERRERRATQSHVEVTVNEEDELTRKALVIVGRTLGTATGAAVVLRVLRIAESTGPRNCVRVEPFAMQAVSGARMWIVPRREVHVEELGPFRRALDVWIDEPEDFQSGPRRPQILARDLYYLPDELRVGGVVQSEVAADGLPIYAEASLDEPMVLGALR